MKKCYLVSYNGKEIEELIFEDNDRFWYLFKLGKLFFSQEEAKLKAKELKKQFEN